MQYGSTAWPTGNKTLQEIIWVGLNKILGMILYRNIYALISQLYKELQVLKVKYIYQLELVRSMYRLHHNQLPKNFLSLFS